MTTYYVDASRPDDTGNGQTVATAKKTVTAGVALLAISGDVLKILPGFYTPTNQIVLAATGLAVQAYDFNDLPVIDGSLITTSSLINIKSSIIDGLCLQNAGGPSYGTLRYGIECNGSNVSSTIRRCRFLRNYRDIRLNAGVVLVEKNTFEDVHNVNIRTELPAGITATVRYNKFLGHRPARGTVNFECNNVSGSQLDIYNNILAGAGSHGINILSTCAGTINIKNNVIVGFGSYSTGYGINNTSVAGAVVNEANNGTNYGSLTTGFNMGYSANITPTNPVTGVLYQGYRNKSYIVIRFDDHDPVDFYLSIAAVLESKGIRGSFAIDTGAATTTEWTAYQTLLAAGHEIACHGYSHCTMQNDVGGACINPFTVQYTGAGTCSFTISSTGSAPNDIVQLSLTETVSGNNIAINLVTGSITGDTTALNLTTLQGIRDYLDGKSYLVCSTFSDGNIDHPELTFSRCLKDVSYPTLTSAANVPFDVARLHYYEMEFPKTAFQSHLGITPTVFAYPNWLSDTRAHDDLILYGYKCALGNVASTSQARGDMQSLSLYDHPALLAGALSAQTDDQIRAYAQSLAEMMTSSRYTVEMMAHTLADLSLAKWDVFLTEIRKYSGIEFVTGEQLADIIRGGEWASTDGKIWTRTAWPDDQLAIAATSPLINAGAIILGIHDQATPATDINGTSVLTVPDIGAYEYPGGLYFNAAADAGGNGTLQQPYNAWTNYTWTDYNLRGGAEIYFLGAMGTLDLSELTDTGAKTVKAWPRRSGSLTGFVGGANDTIELIGQPGQVFKGAFQ